MRILFINRSKDCGPSIRRVFQPIITKIAEENVVDSVYLPEKRAGILSLLRNCFFIIRYLRDNPKYDIIHLSGEVNYILYCLFRYQSIVTVHDLGFYAKEKNHLKKALFFLIWIFPLKTASLITFISETSSKEANRIINLSKVKQEVIPNPIDSSYKFIPKQPNIKRPIILHIGTKENKNLERVICAVSSLCCELIIVGELTNRQIQLLKENHVSYISKKQLSDYAIHQEYINCDLVSFPSTYEGFGMPIIEGQAIGRPVITSNLPPMNKIAGQNAVLVNPLSIESIKSGFVSALKDYNSIVTGGLLNIKKYSVEEVVKQYLKCYADCLHL